MHLLADLYPQTDMTDPEKRHRYLCTQGGHKYPCSLMYVKVGGTVAHTGLHREPEQATCHSTAARNVSTGFLLFLPWLGQG